MKSTKVVEYTYVGVDVSKAKLDAFRANTKKSETINNEEADMRRDSCSSSKYC